MADIAGLVLSVATAWKTCVQIFDIIDSSRKYGMDYEILRIKLEVERVRLLAWGEAVGLTGLSNSQFMPDPRLQSREIQSMVIQLLGCIQKMFENSETLQSKYGLRPSAALTDNQVDWGRATPQAQTALGSIFTRAYSNLQRSAKERQRSTTLARKTLWAVHDRKKFRTMVAEIKGFNENLESLFPDVKVKAAEAMRQDIGRSDQIQDLRLLQEATAGEYEDISESASVRLETLGAAAMDLSDRLSAEDETVRLGESDEEDDCGSAVGQGEGGDGWKTPRTGEKEMDELSKRLHEVELFEGKKGKGALCVSLLKPDSSLARASTHVWWEGYPQEQTWRIHVIERKTVISVSHGSFELYHRKKFTQKRQMKHEMDMYSDEYFVFFDIESDPQYESAHPGTVTLEGFGLECWDYKILFGRKRDINILVSYNDLPTLPSSKILRRMDELYRETGQVGWNPWHDMADLREFTGELTAMTLAGSKFVQPQPTAHLAADLYSLLNRLDIFADFTTKSSIAEEWGGPTGQCVGVWNFFRQMVITRELARRLASYDVDGPVMGFTTKILASLIIADRWFQNVQIRLADMSLDRSSIPKTVTSLQKDKAEYFKRQGNEATWKKKHQLAVDLYTEAIKIDLGNAVYRNNCSGALYDLGRYPEALDDALVATKLNPTYAKAWARLGLAHLRLGRGKRAKEALQRAIELAGRNVTNTMRKGLEDADAKIKADMKAVEGEKNKEQKRSLHAAFLNEDWDLTGRTVQMHSRVYGQQTKGLILFTEQMQWPYLNKVRDYAEAIYRNLVSGQITPSHLHDWMFGMMLPGK